MGMSNLDAGIRADDRGPSECELMMRENAKSIRIAPWTGTVLCGCEQYNVHRSWTTISVNAVPHIEYLVRTVYHQHSNNFQNTHKSHSKTHKTSPINITSSAKMRASTILFTIASVATGAHATIVEEFFNADW